MGQVSCEEEKVGNMSKFHFNITFIPNAQVPANEEETNGSENDAAQNEKNVVEDTVASVEDSPETIEEMILADQRQQDQDVNEIKSDEIFERSRNADEDDQKKVTNASIKKRTNGS